MLFTASLGVAVVLGSDQWSGWFGLDKAAKAMLDDTLPLACGWLIMCAMACGALRSNLTGMGLVRFASVVQVVAFYPIGLLVRPPPSPTALWTQRPAIGPWML